MLSAAAVMPTLPVSADKWGSVLPKRLLGKTGERVTCLGLGGYHIGWTTEESAAATIEAALEEGVRFFDTAEGYGPHTSEERYGRYLTPKYRDQIFLMTKSTHREAQGAREHLEASLRRMKTDVIDLWQMHGVRDPADVDNRLDNGVLKMALEAQSEGKIRFIGFTGHRNPYAHLRMLQRTADMPEPFVATQFPVNPVDVSSKASFIERLMPEAQERKLGLLAMKTLAAGRFFTKVVANQTVWETEDPVIPGAVSIVDCTRFALSLPISVLIAGAEKPEFIRDKAAIVRDFQKMSLDDRQALVQRLARFTEAKVEYYKDEALRA